MAVRQNGLCWQMGGKLQEVAGYAEAPQGRQAEEEGGDRPMIPSRNRTGYHYGGQLQFESLISRFVWQTRCVPPKSRGKVHAEQAERVSRARHSEVFRR